MKRRMYLRGFGLGIIMTALVLSFGIKTENGTMSDAEVRQRALELGMVDESTTLTSELPKAEPTPDEKAEEPVDDKKAEEPEVEEKAEEPVSDKKAEEPESDEKVEEPEVDDKTEVEKPEAEKPEADKKVEESATDKKAETNIKEDEKKTEEPVAVEKAEEKPEEKPAEKVNTNNKDYTLTVKGGYSSDTVAKILADAGVVDSAASFDKYLCDNGYDNRISVGTYKIPAGSDYATIAKLITHSK